jgi:hypothetical protein
MTFQGGNMDISEGHKGNLEQGRQPFNFFDGVHKKYVFLLFLLAFLF